MKFRPSISAAVIAFAWYVLTGLSAAADTLSSRTFFLNQTMAEEISTGDAKQACNYEKVLPDLFAQIGPEAIVYPTENYYYFRFFKDGKLFSASLRLAVDQRDKGIIQFACYETSTSWLDGEAVTVTTLDLAKKQGVGVTKLGRLRYAVSYKGRSVAFLLNDLDQTAPAATQPDEKFVGRAFDESGLVFQLTYHTKLKVFFFVLDQERSVTETFVRAGANLVVGKRTGFVFFNDGGNRQILIAVHADEVHSNSWNDGPFDQLPENFYGDIGFWETVFNADPSMRGKVSKSGVMLDDPSTIFAIWAYQEYANSDDLAFVERCEANYEARAERLACLTGQLK